MNRTLWAPWRMAFIEQAHKKGGGCLLCRLGREKGTKKNLVLHRDRLIYVILNRYPYSNGHLMVVTRRHVGDFEKLTRVEHLEMALLISRSTKILKKVLRAQGFNIGINLGRPAGAGIEGHLHYHVVPRWVGDSNFMPIVGKTRVMPEYLEGTYVKLAKLF